MLAMQYNSSTEENNTLNLPFKFNSCVGLSRLVEYKPETFLISNGKRQVLLSVYGLGMSSKEVSVDWRYYSAL